MCKISFGKDPAMVQDYNEYYPHKELKMKSPREYMRSQPKLELGPVKQGVTPTAKKA